MALEESDIIEKTIDKNYLISCDYKHLNLVMRIIKEKQIKVISQTMEMDCRLEIAVRKKDSEAIYNIFDRIYEVTIKPLQC
jgi:putative IMPACT (imprinted ancient) family translation regulator